MSEEQKIRSAFMIVLSGRAKLSKKRTKPMTIRDIFYVDGNRPVDVVPADLLSYAEAMAMQKYNGEFTAINAFKVMLSDHHVPEEEDGSSEEE